VTGVAAAADRRAARPRNASLDIDILLKNGLLKAHAESRSVPSGVQ
jgi:hypothetical protein